MKQLVLSEKTKIIFVYILRMALALFVMWAVGGGPIFRFGSWGTHHIQTPPTEAQVISEWNARLGATSGGE